MSVNLTIHLRPVVRGILAFQPAVWFTEARVFASVRDDAQWGEATLEAVVAALQWNADEGHAERRLDRERTSPPHMVHQWRISEQGLEKVNSEL